MKRCQACGHELSDESLFCTQCGNPMHPDFAARPLDAGRTEREEMNMPLLYGMVALLLLALVFPPWETPGDQAPAFLGFHFILSPPEAGMIDGDGEVSISWLLLTIELTTIAIGGFYLSWLLRKKTGGT